MKSYKKSLSYTFFFLLALLLFTSLFQGEDKAHAARAKKQLLSVPLTTYYRSVYLLMQLSPAAAEEKVIIPPKVRRADETESLESHPDKIQVLRRIISDLASIRKFKPEAKLFEAYGLLALGDTVAGIEILADYLRETPYSARRYLTLCEALKKANDPLSLYIFCNEWAAIDTACLPRRLILTWEALVGLGRFSQAEILMQGGGECLGWGASVYEARAQWLNGSIAESGKKLQYLKVRYPQDEKAIAALWRKLSFISGGASL